VLLIASLDSAMLGMALYFALDQFGGLNWPFTRAAWVWSVALFALGSALQWFVYFRRLETEKAVAAEKARYGMKLEHFEPDGPDGRRS
jgi:hypothetical protein